VSRSASPVSRPAEDRSSEQVAPLRRRRAGGGSLRRPPEVEAEIAAVLGWSVERIVRRARAGDAAAPGCLSSECLVHLIRHDLRGGGRRLAERLAPLLLARCATILRRSLRGFSGAAREDVRAEILGRLAELLVAPGDAADFFEVRFARAFKCLTIDVCRRERRHLERRVLEADLTPEAVGREAAGPAARRPLWTTAPPSPEARLALRQALAAMSAEERQALVLHRLIGMSINGTRGGPSLVEVLGVSERTVRNRLRRAEAKLVDSGGRR